MHLRHNLVACLGHWTSDYDGPSSSYLAATRPPRCSRMGANSENGSAKSDHESETLCDVLGAHVLRLLPRTASLISQQFQKSCPGTYHTCTEKRSM
eukprot:6429336-Amphidinium_carterae.1